MLAPPDALATITIAREGDAGRAWIAALPALVDELLARWRLEPDGEPTHGQVALVVPVASPHGPAALKVSYPHDGNRGEPLGLRAFGGRGAVRLLEADDDALAMLLERAGPRHLAAHGTAEEGIEIAGALAARLAIPAPAAVPSLAGAAVGWERELDGQLAELAARGVDGPDAGAVAAARASIRSLAAHPCPTMLHGDLHHGNVLEGEREPWLAIDPKGLRGPAAYDAFTVALSRHEELAAAPDPVAALAAHVRRFARAAGVDEEESLDLARARAVSSHAHALLHGAWADAALLGAAATMR